jgi:hypothetical protein
LNSKLGDRTKRGYSNVKGFAVGANAEGLVPVLATIPKYWIEARVAKALNSRNTI